MKLCKGWLLNGERNEVERDDELGLFASDLEAKVHVLNCPRCLKKLRRDIGDAQRVLKWEIRVERTWKLFHPETEAAAYYKGKTDGARLFDLYALEGNRVIGTATLRGNRVTIVSSTLTRNKDMIRNEGREAIT